MILHSIVESLTPESLYCVDVCRSEMIIYCVFVIFLLIGQVSAQSQCYTSSNCTGDTVPADDVRDCCVGTDDGQSYGVVPGNCEVSQCVGEIFF